MAQIITKYSTTSGTSPSGLTTGEMAVNISDKKLYIGGTAGTVSLSDSYVNTVNGVTGAFVISAGPGITFRTTPLGISLGICYIPPTGAGNTFAGKTAATGADYMLLQTKPAGASAGTMYTIRVVDFLNTLIANEGISFVTYTGSEAPQSGSYIVQTVVAGATTTNYNVDYDLFRDDFLSTIDGGTFG